MEEGIHIALSAEKITEVFGIPITNTLITSWIVMGILAVIAVILGRNLAMVPNKFQLLFETGFGFILNYMEETLESRKLAIKFFPLIMTLFLFIFAANVLEFTPGIGSIGLYHEGEFTPLLRSVNTDLNVTLALTLISFFVIEFAGVAALGFLKYAKRFVNVRSVLGFFIGLIELVSEIARLISFSFRLFGNIFAGEVLILVAAFFVPLFIPVPLMLFEVFVGFIQAAIFALLTLFFIKIAVTDTH
jgi:F-type H+-transporting ATPase subunit a|tara:strand:+ start:25338 stop:26075 length:738 start_codon:yes stop_codon:yes gene_type:complete